jgi:hypothetical protein
MKIEKVETNYGFQEIDSSPVILNGVYAGMAADAIGEAYCTTDACEVKLITENNK